MPPILAFQIPTGVCLTTFSSNPLRTRIRDRPITHAKPRAQQVTRSCIEIPGIDNASRAAAKAAAAEVESDNTPEAEMGKFRGDVPLMNTIMLTGRLGADPTLRQVGRNNVSLCTFSLAVNSMRTKADGTRHTSWFRVNIWGAQGERAAGMMRKGLRVGVVGMVGVDEYKDREGRQRSSVVVHAKSFEVLQSRSEFGGDIGTESSQKRGGADSYAALRERSKARRAPAVSRDNDDNVDPF